MEEAVELAIDVKENLLFQLGTRLVKKTRRNYGSIQTVDVRGAQTE
jgi:hypothetical protein